MKPSKSFWYDETLYLGCKNNNEIAIPGKSHTIRFCYSTMYSTCTILSQINRAYVNAHQLAEEDLSNKPYHVSVFWPTLNPFLKRKKTDTESAYYKMRWYFLNLVPPTNGLIVSFYDSKNIKATIDSSFEARHIWPTKKQWSPKGEYIAVHDFEPLIGNPKKREQIEQKYLKYMPIIEKHAKKNNLKIKLIDYSTPMDEMYKIMINCDCLFSYQGASYYFASSTGTPVAGFHHKDRPEKSKKVEGKYFNIKTNTFVTDYFTRTQWGEMRSNPSILPRLDLSSNRIMLGPLKNYTTIYNEDDVLYFLESNTHVTN